MFTDWLKAQARARPQGIALVFGAQTWNYQELDDWVEGWCGRLAGLSLTAGERLGVCLPNHPVVVALVHAAARLGLILVPLNTRLTPPELAWQVTETGCTLVIGEWDGGEPPLLGCPVIPPDALAQRDPVPFQPAPFSLDTRQAIVFTSGTSGRPKGAMLTFANHFWSAAASAFRLGLWPEDRWLTCLPLYHVGGQAILFRSALYGTAVVLQAGFDLEAISHSLDREGITLVSLVPTMLVRLLERRTHWPDSLRLILLGGAAAEPALIQQANQLPRLTAPPTPLVAPTYGLSEAASQVATLLPAEAQIKPGSVGKPLLFTTVEIVDEQGYTLPSGKIGELVVRGPTVMAGYWQDAAATGQTIRAGALFTGDLGYLDGDGDLWLVQRRTDLIVTGGENVYPAEVEAVLKQHPGVAAACVVGLPHPQWGQQLAALIVPHPAQTVTPEELIAFARHHLAGYKIPRLIRLTDTLPQTSSGKIERWKVVSSFSFLVAE
ncbi:MAG: o-succinylbenzoate--CoA ligase [Anaerolineae bacterium]|nr:o-succinylbenzoate--CoA ligase [Anaerolineae bacterium]